MTASSDRATARPLLAALALFAVSACGTTVNPSAIGEAQAGGPLQQGGTPPGQAPLVEPGSSGAGALPGSAPTGAGSSTDRSGGTQFGSVPGRSGTGQGSGAAATSMPAAGFGYDAKNVYIGVTLASDTSTALKGAGLNSVDAGDQFAQARAMASYYNKRGGILGRKVQLRFDDHSSAALSSQPQQEAQAVCEKFTQDEPVVAVINTQTLLDQPNLRACLKKKGLPMFGVSITAIDDQVLKESDGLYIPTLTPTWTRFAPVFVESLVSRRYFTGWDTRAGAPGSAPVKVGVFIHEDPVTQRAYEAFAAALARAGHPVAEVFKYQDVGSGGSAAVLRMSSAGVTHMFGLDPNIFVFATAAESQRYRPRYGLSTANGPGLLFEANAPKAQSNGALALDTAPSLDVLQFPGEVTAAGKLCRDIMAANGQTFEGKRFAEAFAFSICDSVRLLAEASTAGGGFARQPFLAGTALVGRTFKTAATYASGLRPGYPVLPGGGRDIAYYPACSCYRLSGTAVRPV